MFLPQELIACTAGRRYPKMKQTSVGYSQQEMTHVGGGKQSLQRKNENSFKK